MHRSRRGQSRSVLLGKRLWNQPLASCHSKTGCTSLRNVRRFNISSSFCMRSLCIRNVFGLAT
jgi:hypothetical protein